MATIVKHSERKERITYCHRFVWRHDKGAGFFFDCDEFGNFDTTKYNENHPNFIGCFSGEFDVIDLGVQREVLTYTEPALLKCDCGETFELYDPFFSECPYCGRSYNGAGQRLRPMEEWGEETGEHPSEVWGYNYPY